MPCLAGNAGPATNADQQGCRQKGRLFYIMDHKSRLRFLADIGAEVSIIPPSKAKRKNQQDTFGLLTASNSPIDPLQ